MKEKVQENRTFTLAIVFGIMYSGMLVLIPFLVSVFITVLKKGGYRGTELSYGVLAIAISLYCVITVLLYLIHYYYSNNYVLLKKRQFEKGLTNKIFMLYCEPSEAISFYNNDITMICDLKYRRIFDFMNAIAFISFGIIYVSFINIYSLLIMVTFLSISVILQIFSSKKISSFYTRYRDNRVRSLKLLTNFINSKFTIKSFNVYDYATKQTQEAIVKSANYEKNSNLVKAISNVVIESVPIAATIFCSALFVVLISNDMILHERVVPIIFISGYLIWEGVKLLKAKNDIDSVKHIEDKINNMILPEKIQTKNFSISFNTLTFRDVNVEPILKNINLNLDVNKKYLIVGASGSGKTTLIKLLIGELSYTGQILCDDKKVERIEKFVGVLPQKCEFISDTVLNNITLCEDYDDSRLFSAMTHAMIPYDWKHRYIDLEKYNFSGGELRKIAFARALYHKPPLLCLDEFTVGLDISSKKSIESMVLGYEGTVIAVSHTADEHFAKHFDGIIVLEKGQIVYSGHYKLMPNHFKSSYIKS